MVFIPSSSKPSILPAIPPPLLRPIRLEIKSGVPATPLLLAISPDNGSSNRDAISNELNFSVNGLATPGTTLTLLRDDSVIDTVTVPDNGVLSLPTTLDAAGPAIFTAFITNNVGTESPLSPPLSVLIDTTPPTVAVDALLTADPAPVITGTVSDTGGSNLDELRVTIDEQTYEIGDRLTLTGSTWS